MNNRTNNSNDEIRTLLGHLVDDIRLASVLVKEDRHSQFKRRIYFRTVFSSIEGVIWHFKQVCWKYKLEISNEASDQLNLPEYSIFTDSSFDLKSNGEIHSTSKHFKLDSNMKFTYKKLNEYFGLDIDLGVGTDDWKRFIDAKQVRNRITHPKSLSELNITDSEIDSCFQMSGWFVQLNLNLLNEFKEQGKLREFLLIE